MGNSWQQDQWAYAQQLAYQQQSQMGSALLNSIPNGLPADFKLIQGNPKKAKYIVSYAFKQAKDPVVFVKDRKDMEKLVESLMNDNRVDQETIMIHEISAQYKPKKSKVILEKVEGKIVR